MAADNTYESDSHVCRILGIQEPEYVQIARTLGVGKDGFEVRGAKAETIGARHVPVSREYRRFLRLRLWSNPKACSMCRFVVQDLIRLRGRKLGALLRSYNKLLNLSIRGCELVYGFDPVFRAQYGKVICIGDCTRKLAESQGFAHVEGCPPTSDRMLEVCYKIKK